MSKVAVSGTVVATETDTLRPYPPSFVDLITNWVRNLPIPSWLFYVSVGLVFLLLNASVQWLDGSRAVGDVTWQMFLSASTLPYMLGLLHYLDNSAHEAMTEFRPAMNVDDRQFAELTYRFTTLPARPAVIASVVGALYGVSYPLIGSPEEIAAQGLFTSLPATILQLTMLALGYGGALVMLYHSIRQLLMVSRTYTLYGRVDLFNLRPMHALSRLAARTAIGVAVPSFGWGFVNVSAQTGAPEVGATSIFELLISNLVILILFVWPLIGARRLLRQAKAAALTEAQQQFKATVAELHRRREAGEFEGMGGINEALDGLMKEQEVLSKVSTWPWQSETFRGVATAILLPIVVWAITRILENVWVF